MHDGMPYGRIQGQGHGGPKVAKSRKITQIQSLSPSPIFTESKH